MRKVKEVLRLKYSCNLSDREIARSCRISRSTVADYIHRAIVAGIQWPEVSGLTQDQMVKRLFPEKSLPSPVTYPRPGFI